MLSRLGVALSMIVASLMILPAAMGAGAPLSFAGAPSLLSSPTSQLPALTRGPADLRVPAQAAIGSAQAPPLRLGTGTVTSAVCGTSLASLRTCPGAATRQAPVSPAVVQPRAGGALNWYNESGSMGPGPNGYAGMLAFDPLLGTQGGETVYFGGCDFTLGCLTNATWEYDGTGWYQVTTATAPPPLYGAGMDFDPAAGGIILVGGQNESAVDLSQVWEYNASGWTNLTGTGWGTAAYPVAFESMAWDPPLNALIIVDGCDGGCSAFYDGTESLNSSGFHYLGNGPGGAIAANDAASMAWDGTDQAMIYFGGFALGTNDLNTTYALEGTTWVDVSLPPAGCFICLVPPAQDFAPMTWDLPQGEVLMFGGHNDTTGSWYNTTWEFDLTDGWSEVDLFFNLSSPPTTAYPVMAVNSTDDAPLLLEGACLTGDPASCAGVDEIFENAPNPYALGNASSSIDVGQVYTLPLGNSAGYGSGPWVFESLNWGDASGLTANQNNLTNSEGFFFYPNHVYAATSTYTIEVDFDDFYDVTGGLTWNVTVSADPAISAFATPSTTEVGGTVGLSANMTLGDPPYSYAWNFGDSTTGAGASVSHQFAVAGTYHVNVTGTDYNGVTSSFLVPVVVDPALHAQAVVARSTVDAGVSDGFTGTGSGGSSTYTTYAWHFGDGGTWSGRLATHTYSSAGNYSAELNITDSLGFVSSSVVTVHVNPSLSAAATDNRSTAPVRGSIGFTEVDSGGTPPVTFSWLFGDGSSSTDSAPSHAYTQAGTFTVHLWVNDSGGGSVEKNLSVSVAAPSTPPGGGGSGGALGGNTILYIVLGVVALAVILAAVLLTRRRKPSPTTPPGSSAPMTTGEPPAGGPPPGAV
jgi:PKD repeat protein